MKIDFENLTFEQTEELNKKARSLLVEYTEFIDFYSRKYGREKYWWCLPVVSRNLFHSKVFNQLCRILLVIDCVEKDSSIHKIRVLTEEEKKCLESYFKNIGSSIKVYCRHKSEWPFKTIVKSIYIFGIKFIEYISAKKVLREKAVPKDRPINLIKMSVLSSCVGEGIYTDRYFNDIHELYGGELYFLPEKCLNDNKGIAIYTKKLQNVKNYNFILGEQFLKFSDYFQILPYGIYCLKNAARNFWFRKLDITPLVCRSMLEGLCSSNSFEGILDDKILYRMKKSGINIRNFIIWYEGRPADVYDVKCYKRHYPKGNCVAYEGFPLDELDMSLVPSKEMITQGIAADIYAVPGQSYIKMAEKYDSKANYMAVPILRNEYEVRKHVISKKPKKILFVLSYSREGVVSQIKYANIIAKKYDDNVKIILKNHPVNINDRVEEFLHDKVYFKPEYVTGALGECLEHVDAAVIYGGSASPLEVLYASVKLIIMMPVGEIAIMYVPQELGGEMYSVVYNEKQFIESISEILDMEGEQYNEFMEGFLESKTREGVRKMFR